MFEKARQLFQEAIQAKDASKFEEAAALWGKFIANTDDETMCRKARQWQRSCYRNAQAVAAV